MRTFILSAYNRFKRYAETTDIKTKLCNRTWIVFNDGGERELYKFREDGSIYIILSGCVTKGTWEYDPSDKSLIITAANQSYMVHPGMHEDILMALQIDGTEECAFLIEENNAQNFAPKSRTELIQYFEEKERKLIEAQQTTQALDEERLRIEAARNRQLEKEKLNAQIRELERQQQEKELKRINNDFSLFLGDKKNLKEQADNYCHRVCICWAVFVFLLIFIFIPIFNVFGGYGFLAYVFLIIPMIFLGGSLIRSNIQNRYRTTYNNIIGLIEEFLEINSYKIDRSLILNEISKPYSNLLSMSMGYDFVLNITGFAFLVGIVLSCIVFI